MSLGIGSFRSLDLSAQYSIAVLRVNAGGDQFHAVTCANRSTNVTRAAQSRRRDGWRVEQSDPAWQGNHNPRVPPPRQNYYRS